MNKERRAMLAKASALLAEAAALVEQAQEGEQEAYENTPESLRDGEVGQAREAMADAIGEALCSINDAAEELGAVITQAEA